MFTIFLFVVAGLLLLTIVYMLTTSGSERGASYRDGNHIGAPFIAMDSSPGSSAEQSGRGDAGHPAAGWGESGAGAGWYDVGWGDSGSGGDGGGGDGGGGGGE